MAAGRERSVFERDAYDYARREGLFLPSDDLLYTLEVTAPAMLELQDEVALVAADIARVNNAARPDERFLRDEAPPVLKRSVYDALKLAHAALKPKKLEHDTLPWSKRQAEHPTLAYEFILSRESNEGAPRLRKHNGPDPALNLAVPRAPKKLESTSERLFAVLEDIASPFRIFKAIEERKMDELEARADDDDELSKMLDVKMSITKSQAALMSSLSGQFRSQVLAAIKAHDAVYEPLQTRPPHKYALDNALDRLRLPSPPLLPRAVEPTPPSLWLPEPLPFTPPSSSPLGPTMEEWNELEGIQDMSLDLPSSFSSRTDELCAPLEIEECTKTLDLEDMKLDVLAPREPPHTSHGNISLQLLKDGYEAMTVELDPDEPFSSPPLASLLSDDSAVHKTLQSSLPKLEPDPDAKKSMIECLRELGVGVGTLTVSEVAILLKWRLPAQDEEQWPPGVFGDLESEPHATRAPETTAGPLSPLLVPTRSMVDYNDVVVEPRTQVTSGLEAPKTSVFKLPLATAPRSTPQRPGTPRPSPMAAPPSKTLAIVELALPAQEPQDDASPGAPLLLEPLPEAANQARDGSKQKLTQNPLTASRRLDEAVRAIQERRKRPRDIPAADDLARFVSSRGISLKQPRRASPQPDTPPSPPSARPTLPSPLQYAPEQPPRLTSALKVVASQDFVQEYVTIFTALRASPNLGVVTRDSCNGAHVLLGVETCVYFQQVDELLGGGAYSKEQLDGRTDNEREALCTSLYRLGSDHSRILAILLEPETYTAATMSALRQLATGIKDILERLSDFAVDVFICDSAANAAETVCSVAGSLGGEAREWPPAEASEDELYLLQVPGMNSIAACAILERFTIADVLSGEHEHELARLLPAKTFERLATAIAQAPPLSASSEAVFQEFVDEYEDN